MATAPTPGGQRREDAASQVFRITIKEETLDYMEGALTLEERVQVRKQVGLPLEAFTAGADALGQDTLAVFWWLAQRQNGKPNLSWKQFGFTWDGYDETRGDLVEVVEDNPEDFLPEGSGPGSETTSLA